MQYTLRNILAACKANMYIRFGYVNRAQKLIKQNKYILSIYFHDPSEEVFRNSVSWLIKENYTFLSLDDLLLIKNNKKEVPVNGVVITVDDGWRDNYKNIVPIANAYKVPVAIFITTQPVLKGDRFWWSYIKMAIKNKFNTISVANLKRMSNKERLRLVDDVRHKVTTQREAMTIQELQEISNSKFITIGSHTVTHPILPNCTNDELRFEIIESKKIIEQIISKPINSFSFPNGDYGSREIEYVKQAGYEISFGIEPKYLTKSSLEGIFNLPRFEVLDNASLAESICRMTGVWFK